MSREGCGGVSGPVSVTSVCALAIAALVIKPSTRALITSGILDLRSQNADLCSVRTACETLGDQDLQRQGG